MKSEESRLSRWSRRKLQAQQQTVEQDVPLENESLAGIELQPETQALQKNDPPAQGTNDPEPVLTDDDMPDINSLSEDSDFSAFMSPGVSDELRNLALRKLFSAPTFNIRDGLDEYDEDYTSFEKLGDIITCDMKHQLEMEAQKKLEQEQEELLQQNDPVSEETQQLTADQAVEGTDTEAAEDMGDELNAQMENNKDAHPRTAKSSQSSEEHHDDIQS